jgi:dTDP-4-dehydrorhamnose 3,5-epimerase
MKIKKTKIKGLFLIKPKIFNDQRGYFLESFNQKLFYELSNVKTNFVQDNQSCSSKAVLRGLHFQNPPFAQAKLVSVIKGSVIDVAVDIRKDSPTYGEYIMEELNEENHLMMYLPEGIAHGFITLEDNTIFTYKCSNYYNNESEDSLIWNDPDIGIKWPNIPPILSEKDKNAKNFASFVSKF